MGRESKINVEKLDDVAICDFFEKASQLIGATGFTIGLAGALTHIEVELGQSNPELDSILSHKGHLILSIATNGDKFSISLSRTPNEDIDSGFDQIRIHNAQRDHPPTAHPLTTEQLIEFNALISSTFKSNISNSAAVYRDPATFKTIMRSHQRMLEQMQSTIASVGEDAAAARTKLEEEYWEKNSALLKEFNKRKRDLDDEAGRIREKIASDERALDERKKALDDRDNTHARRALHTTLKHRLAEHSSKFELTESTNRRRLPIHVAVCLSIAGLVALIVFNSLALAPAAPADFSTVTILMLVKPIGLTVALLGLLSWYLRWMNRWFERHADAEFQLKQFELDIDRASWVVETALEWREAQDNPIPGHLLENISRNLFTRGEKDETADIHPADYLASALLGRAAGVRLKVPGGEIEYGPKAFKDAGKEA